MFPCNAVLSINGGFMSNYTEDEDFPADLQPDTEDGDMDISFDDAPPQVKPTIAVKAPKAPKKAAAVAPAVAAPQAAPTPKPKAKRKPTVAKAAPAPKSKHHVQTVDSNKLEAYLDKIVNEEGQTLISVSGSSSIMGAFAVVSVKVA
jgi:hypothetical protein